MIPKAERSNEIVRETWENYKISLSDNVVLHKSHKDLRETKKRMKEFLDQKMFTYANLTKYYYSVSILEDKVICISIAKIKNLILTLDRIEPAYTRRNPKKIISETEYVTNICDFWKSHKKV